MQDLLTAIIVSLIRPAGVRGETRVGSADCEKAKEALLKQEGATEVKVQAAEAACF